MFNILNEADTKSDIYVGKKCLIRAGERFYAQGAQIMGYDAQDNHYQVKTVAGAEL